MSLELPRLISMAEMQAAALQNLGLPSAPQAPSALTVQAAVLRAALWALSRAGTEPVYVTRLLNAACRLAEPLLKPKDLKPAPLPGTTAGADTLLAGLRGVLEELEAVGDVAQLPRGRWLPAPLRFVQFTAIHQWVLVGGYPTHLLPAALRVELTHIGVARLIPRDPAELGVALPCQSETAWCAAPREPVTAWARRVLDSAVVLPFTEHDTALEFYSPSAARAAGAGKMLQYFRWTQNANALPDGRHLARIPFHQFYHRHLVAEVRGGRVVATGPLELYEGDLRRMLYGLDAEAGLPVTVSVKRTENAYYFELRNELPRAEYRLLMVLGRLHLPPDGRYYPRTWEVPSRYAAQAVAALRRLGIQLQPDKPISP